MSRTEFTLFSSSLDTVALRRARNRRHDPLPTELWRFVFSHFSADEQIWIWSGAGEPRAHLIAVTHVCHAWRSHVVSESFLWSSVRVHNNWACDHPRLKRTNYGACPGKCLRGFWSEARRNEYDQASTDERHSIRDEAEAYRVCRAQGEAGLFALFVERSRTLPFRLNLAINHAPCPIILAGIEQALFKIQSSHRLLHFDFEFSRDHSSQALRIIRMLQPTSIRSVDIRWCLEYSWMDEDETFRDIRHLVLPVDETIAALPVQQLFLEQSITWQECQTKFYTLTDLTAFFWDSYELLSCLEHCPRLHSLKATLNKADFYDATDERQDSLRGALCALNSVSLRPGGSYGSTSCEIVKSLVGDAGGPIQAANNFEIYIDNWRRHTSHKHGSAYSGYYHQYNWNYEHHIGLDPRYDVLNHLGDIGHASSASPPEIRLQKTEGDEYLRINTTLTVSSIDGSRSRRLVMDEGLPKKEEYDVHILWRMWDVLSKYNVVSLELPLDDVVEFLRNSNPGQLNCVKSLVIVIHGDEYGTKHNIAVPELGPMLRGNMPPLTGVEDVTLEQQRTYSGSREGGNCSFSSVRAVIALLAQAGAGSFKTLHLNLSTDWSRDDLWAAYTFAQKVKGIPHVEDGWFHLASV